MEMLGLIPYVWIMPLVTVVLLTVVAVGIWFWRTSNTYSDRETAGSIMTVAGGVVGSIVLIITICLLVPYQSQYWHYYKVSGHVTSASNQFTAGTGDNTSTKFVLKVDTLGSRIVTSDDYRVSQFKVGDKINLTCTLGWQYNAQQTIDCSVRSY